MEFKRRSPKLIFGIWAPYMFTAVLIAGAPQPPPPPAPSHLIWAHIQGRYWSAKKDDISLCPPGYLPWTVYIQNRLCPNRFLGPEEWRISEEARQTGFLKTIKTILMVVVFIVNGIVMPQKGGGVGLHWYHSNRHEFSFNFRCFRSILRVQWRLKLQKTGFSV